MELLFSVFAVISLAAILLLGIEVGLLSKFFKFSLKKHIIISFAYALIIFAIVYLLSPFYNEVLNQTFYSFYYYIIMGIVSLILGLIILFYWSKHKTYDKFLKILLYIDFVPISYTLILLSSALMAPSFAFEAQNISFDLTMVNSGLILAILLIFIMIIFYIFSDFVEDYRITDYSIIFGSMLLIFGFAYLILGFIAPNMARIFTNPSTELNIYSIESLVVVVVILAILLALGAIFKKKNNRLI